MSVVPIPKPYAERPPFRGGPPTRTTFDGTPPDDPEPEWKKLADDVHRLLRTVERVSNDRLETLLSLLQQRRRWVSRELDAMRLFSVMPLPPVDGLALEFLLESESEAETQCVRLINQLDAAIETVKGKLWTLNGPISTSDS
ncbi:MAG TPA: hypothetical protein VG944_16510 [Fimbriimonas sp.]|nr:hypothetical protein [Fimbriimonas sp.]